MVVTREGFTRVVGNAFAGLGFPAEGPSVFEFPMKMFAKGDDLSAIRQNLDKVVYGLTKWAPKTRTKGTFAPPKVMVTGKDYAGAVAGMNHLFLRNLWSDALPLLPPTEDQVRWMLRGTDLAPTTVVAKILPRGAIATVEDLAVSLVMAGGRPEYLPVLIAAVQAITRPEWGLSAANPTTDSVIPAIIVNGPVAAQIHLNSGYGLLGPDPQHPAGQAIGRALRLVQQNLGGAIPGVGTMSLFGGMRTTNAVFAEDEEGIPPGWKSLSGDRGFPGGANVVTATPVNGGMNMAEHFGTKPVNDGTLTMIAKFMSIPNGNTWSPVMTLDDWNSPDLARGVVLIPRGIAASLAQDSGYSKLDVKTFLWKKAKIPWSDLQAMDLAQSFILRATRLGVSEGGDLPLACKPEQITIVVAGGKHSGHCYWMPVGHSNRRLVSQEIRLPEKAEWDSLLQEAENDLYSKVSCGENMECSVPQASRL
ncbi:MAG: hypothetical protein HY673_08780 [Chloroflexi bacterium]|nr:hypothetical protein [Chloroflexota bacterium]